jgi:hypothetical protein
MIALNLNYLSNALSLNTMTMGVKASTYEFFRDTIQSIERDIEDPGKETQGDVSSLEDLIKVSALVILFLSWWLLPDAPCWGQRI